MANQESTDPNDWIVYNNPTAGTVVHLLAEALGGPTYGQTAVVKRVNALTLVMMKYHPQGHDFGKDLQEAEEMIDARAGR